ncbi:hypothetical protein AB4097_08920 [Microvirga sp. 2MCAF35]|uniref:hypothetical protein n=1 Tax=Microvirga sp. 2MCAF35 TaxID=3232987 RepID=UPI003F982B01
MAKGNKSKQVKKAVSVLEQQLKEIKNRPIFAARKCQKAIADIDRKHLEAIYEQVAIGYALAQHLSKDKVARGKFLKAGIWKDLRQKPKNTQEHWDNILLWVMRFILKNPHAPVSRIYDRAHHYASALKFLWDAKVDAKDVPERLLAGGGFRGLLKERKRASEVGRDEPDENTVAELEFDHGGFLNGAPPSDARKDDKRNKPRPKVEWGIPDSELKSPSAEMYVQVLAQIKEVKDGLKLVLLNAVEID